MKVIFFPPVFVIVLWLTACEKKPDTQTSSFDREYCLLKLHYENASGEKGITTFDYNGVSEY